MKIKLVLVAFLFAAARCASAEWQVLASNEEPSLAPGIVHQHVVLQDAVTDDRSTLELAVFPAKLNTLRVLDNPDGSKSLTDAMRSAKCLAGVNGGYFDPAFKPIGLLVIDGKTIAPLQHARLLTGVLFSSERGVQIVRVREFSRAQKISAAVECGPFLVEAGRPVKGLDATRSARRTFAAVAGDRAALGFCSDVSLSDLGKILTAVKMGSDLKIQRALNLDGGSSSAFWFKRGEGSALSISEQKTVRDFVGVAAK